MRTTLAILFALSVAGPVVADGSRPGGDSSTSQQPTPLELARAHAVDYRDPKSVDESIRLFRKAIDLAPDAADKWSARFGLFQTLRLPRTNVEEQAELAAVLMQDADWSRDDACDAALCVLDFQIFDLKNSEARNLAWAEALAHQVIAECKEPNRFARRVDAEVKLLRILREREGPKFALLAGKLMCLEVSQAIENGVLDRKRNPSARQRIYNGTAIDNLGLYVAQLVKYMEPMERADAIRDLDAFIIDNRLPWRISGAIGTGLEEFRVPAAAPKARPKELVLVSDST